MNALSPTYLKFNECYLQISFWITYETRYQAYLLNRALNNYLTGMQ